MITELQGRAGDHENPPPNQDRDRFRPQDGDDIPPDHGRGGRFIQDAPQARDPIMHERIVVTACRSDFLHDHGSLPVGLSAITPRAGLNSRDHARMVRDPPAETAKPA